jgi:hypothetical protein
MQPAPAVTITQPAGWSPGPVAPSTSTRAGGLLRGGIDAWRGTPERSVGVGLTDAQVATLAPFLSQQMQLEERVVRGDLDRVRVHVGGLAKDAGNVATTIGTDIYVSDAARATRLLDWSGRTWLAHELVHTMQWRQLDRPGMTDAQRDRTFLNRYVSRFVADEGAIGKGGLATALRQWLDNRKSNGPKPGMGDLLHDAHPMEREAIRVATAFKTLAPR